MNVETLREFCLSLENTADCFPFDNDTLVFKVSGKIFAIVNLVGDLSVNIKCDPEMAIELKEHYSAVLPGYHMNKKHWILVMLDGSIDDYLVCKWIANSYKLVAKKQKK